MSDVNIGGKVQTGLEMAGVTTTASSGGITTMVVIYLLVIIYSSKMILRLTLTLIFLDRNLVLTVRGCNVGSSLTVGGNKRLVK